MKCRTDSQRREDFDRHQSHCVNIVIVERQDASKVPAAEVLDNTLGLEANTAPPSPCGTSHGVARQMFIPMNFPVNGYSL